MPKLPDDANLPENAGENTTARGSDASPKGNHPDAKSVATDAVARGALGEKNAERVEQVRRTAENIKRTKQAGSTAVKAAGPVVKVLLFPGTWVIIAIVVLMGVLYAGSQTIGQNEMACGGGGESSGSTQAGQLTKNAEGYADYDNAVNVLMTWLTSNPFKLNDNKPLSKEQAAGILGNWSQESQLTPWNTQSKWISFEATNAQVRAAGESSGGRAIGLAQWDSGRKKALLDYADSKGAVWSDLQTQLDYFKIELDGTNGDGYDAKMTKKAGFFEPGKSAEEYTRAFEEGFERAGKPAYENRIKAANEIMSKWSGQGGSTSGGGAASCPSGDGGGSFDNSDIAAMAISIAYPTKAQALTHGGDGADIAPPAYKAAKAKAAEIGGPDGMPNLYASCDRFVATVLRNTVDPEVPWGNTAVQTAYFKNSPKYQPYHKKSELQPGDVLVTNKRGHIIIYIGDYNGVDSLAHASIYSRVGAITPNYLSETLTDPRQYTAYRYTGG